MSERVSQTWRELHPDTRGDLSWHSLAEQLGFSSTADLITFVDLTADQVPDCRATVPAEIESAARYGVDIARALLEAARL